MERVYICIDLKAFYASCECVFRNLDPLNTHLVVADASKTEKTICLAISPSLKTYGLGGRGRLFEVEQKLKEINIQRLKKIKDHTFKGESYFFDEINNNQELEVTMVIAPPQMAKYIEVSSKIYQIYLKYVAKEDIHVYSIDEVFMDVTKYLKALNMTAKELATTMINDVLKQTGITATAGIGENLYLSKVAMDIVAKHVEADKNGVRIAELDMMSYRKLLWSHRPLSSFWRIGGGIARRLEKLNCYTMGDIALLSLKDEDVLYEEFGINAELIIDHAWGYEPTLIEHIKQYKPNNTSLGSGQVLSRGYTFEETLIVVKEMVDQLSLDLVEKGLLTNAMNIGVSYDIDSLKDEEVRKAYAGGIIKDMYGRIVPKPTHGLIKFNDFTSSTRLMVNAINEYLINIVNPILLVRKINISLNTIKEEDKPCVVAEQLSLFVDYQKVEEEKRKRENENRKEKSRQKAILAIKKRYGKNAIFKGVDLTESATQLQRNDQIGGHKA